MASVAIHFLHLFITFGLAGIGTSVRVEFAPTNINKFLTKELNITCRMNDQYISSRSIVTMEIGKKGEAITAILQQSGVSDGPAMAENMKIEGHINEEASQSYLRLTIQNPGPNDAGTYICMAFYLDNLFQIQEEQTYGKVTMAENMTEIIHHLLGRISVLETTALRHEDNKVEQELYEKQEDLIMELAEQGQLTITDVSDVKSSILDLKNTTQDLEDKLNVELEDHETKEKDQDARLNDYERKEEEQTNKLMDFWDRTQKENIAELKDFEKKQKEQLKEYETRLKQQESKLLEQEITLKTYESVLKDLDAKLIEQNSTIKNQKIEQRKGLEDHDKNITEQKTKLKKQETELKEQRKTLEDQDTKIKQQEMKLKDYETKLADYETKLNDLLCDYQSLNDTVGEQKENQELLGKGQDDIGMITDKLTSEIQQLYNMTTNQRKDIEDFTTSLADVTKQFQIQAKGGTTYTTAFSVSRIKKNTVKTNSRLLFADTWLNYGHYNVNTGIFTAPKNGIYAFHLTYVAWDLSSPTYEEIHLVANGRSVGRLYVNRNYHYTQSSGSVVVYLKAGQQVYPLVKTANRKSININQDNLYSMFSGFLLDLV